MAYIASRAVVKRYVALNAFAAVAGDVVPSGCSCCMHGVVALVVCWCSYSTEKVSKHCLLVMVVKLT